MDVKKILITLIAIGVIFISLNIEISWKKKHTLQVNIEAQVKFKQKQQ